MNRTTKGYLLDLSEEEIIDEAGIILSDFGIDYAEGYIFCGECNECYCDVTEAFCDIREELETSLITTLESGNIAEYAVHVHGLKGNAKSIGAAKLAEIAYEHEMKSKAGDIEFCKNNWDILHEEWQVVIAGLQKYLWAMDVYDGGLD